MGFDRNTLAETRTAHSPPTFRLFTFANPTLSYGRLQTLEHIGPLIPAGWTAVRRPTGGGIVFHNGDLCFSLCWPNNTSSLPTKLRAIYAWIHSVVQVALRPYVAVDSATASAPPAGNDFHRRECFAQPVEFDLLARQRKIVGGALYRGRHATLYQGAIQLPAAPALAPALRHAFQCALA